MIFLDEYVALSNDSISTKLCESENEIPRIKKVFDISKQGNQVKLKFLLSNGLIVKEVKDL
ncbi:MAG: hypothetical protein ACK5N8_05220 [Alphaproteobacteria bacterium]